MSCVVGLEEDGVIWMGCDSRGEQNGAVISLRSPAKIQKVGEYLFGICGQVVTINAIQHNLDLPTPPKTNVMRFVSRTIIPKLKACMNEVCGAYNKLPTNNQLLLGVRGRLIHIDENMQFYQVKERYTAIGSGTPHAKSAMFAMNLTAPELSQELRIKTALMSAEKFCSSVGRPFPVLCGAEK